MESDPYGLSFEDAGGPKAPPAGPDEFGLNFEDAGAPKGGPSVAKPSPPAAEWGAGLHFLDAMLMGHGPKLASMASRAAGWEGAMTGGAPPAHMAGEEAQVERRLAKAREDWAKEHPTAALASEVGGSAVPALGALVGQEYALAPLAGVASRFAPWLVNLLRGTAGSEMTGLTGVGTRAASRAVRGGIEGAEITAGEKAAKGEPVTFEDIKRGAMLGGVVNPAVRSFMPRARVLSPQEAQAISLMRAGGFPLPAYHPSQVGRAAGSLVRRAGSEARESPMLAGLLTLAGATEGPQLVRMGAEMLPGGGLTAGAAAVPAVAAAVGNRFMSRPQYQQRILDAAMGHGVYPYTRVNPLLPFMAPMVQPEFGAERP